MKYTSITKSAAVLLVAASTTQAAVLFSDNFDAADGDFDNLNNGANGGITSNEATGVVTTGGQDAAGGFLANTAVDTTVDGATAFTVTWVIDSASNWGNVGTNGSFFGVQSVVSGGTYGTNGPNLWGNANTDSFGFVLNMENAPGTNFGIVGTLANVKTEIFLESAANVDATSVQDGFTVALTLDNTGGWSLVTTGLEQGGLDADVDTSGTGGLAYYNAIADGAHVTAQLQNDGAPAPGFTAGSVTLEHNAVAVPEPSSVALLGLGGLALILRRRK